MKHSDKADEIINALESHKAVRVPGRLTEFEHYDGLYSSPEDWWSTSLRWAAVVTFIGINVLMLLGHQTNAQAEAEYNDLEALTEEYSLNIESYTTKALSNELVYQ